MATGDMFQFGIEPTSPLTSRTRFKWRSFSNIVGLLAIFALLLPSLLLLARAFLPGFLGVLIANVAAFATIYFLYTVWDARPIRMRCENCKKIILSNTPWTCGFCKKGNSNANEYPFVGKCGHCGDEPKAYQCHHCGQLVFFSEDQAQTNFAYCLNFQTPDPSAEKLAQHQKTRREKVEEIAVAELELKLKEIQARSAPPKTAREQRIEFFEREYDGIMGLREYIRKRKADVAIQYQNDPVALKDANDALDAIAARHI